VVHLSQGDSYTLEVNHAVTANGVRQMTITLLPVLDDVCPPPSRGATFAQIASLPTFTAPRKRKRAMTETGKDSAKAAEATSCTICMDDYKGGEKLCTLPCSHVYHLKVNSKKGTSGSLARPYATHIFYINIQTYTRSYIHTSLS
jgi:hypothetical protein